MDSLDVNRRGFLKSTATATAVGASLAGSVSAGELSRKEVANWTNRIGSRFRVGSAELKLQSIYTTDHSTESSRPGSLRIQSLAMLFVLDGGRVCAADTVNLRLEKEDLLLQRVIPPLGETGEFYEAILN